MFENVDLLSFHPKKPASRAALWQTSSRGTAAPPRCYSHGACFSTILDVRPQSPRRLIGPRTPKRGDLKRHGTITQLSCTAQQDQSDLAAAT